MRRTKTQGRRKRIRAAGSHQGSEAKSAYTEFDWRAAEELLGKSWWSKQEAEADVFEVPHDVACAIAVATKVQIDSIDEFQTALARTCAEVSRRCAWISLIKAQRPLTLLNRISRTARQLSQDLSRLDNFENKGLDGALGLVFPRVVLRARADRGKAEVAKGVWAFLECGVYAHLLAGLAACAEVAAGKADLLEVGLRFGVRGTFNAERDQEQRRSVRHLPKVSNVPLRVLISGLRDLIVREAHGKLTLWNDPVGGGVKGTLPEVLAILRPYLPDVIPVKVNYRTLRRYMNIKS